VRTHAGPDAPHHSATRSLHRLPQPV